MHRLRIHLRVKYMPSYRYYVYLAIDPMYEYLLPSFEDALYYISLPIRVFGKPTRNTGLTR